MLQRSRLIKNETGLVLVYVTITLALAMLIIPPLLGFISGAGRSAQIREDRMLQVYAADAGIEEGYLKIIGNNTIGLPESPEAEPWTGNISDVNDNDVLIQIYKEPGEGVYKILSTATNYDGISTTIESYTASRSYNFLLDNALSSYSDITLKNNVSVTGNVTLPGEQIGQGWDDLDEEQVHSEYVEWPSNANLILHYDEGFGTECCPSCSSIYLTTSRDLGPCKQEGNLAISSGNTSAILTLQGNLYVAAGNLDLGMSHVDFTLDLNEHTIFCEGEISIGAKCNIIGSGCIIALGDFYFGPKSGTEPNEFVFIMSATGTLTAQPNGTYYGSMAGHIDIVKAGTEIVWVDYEQLDLNLDFPKGERKPSIITYTILE